MVPGGVVLCLSCLLLLQGFTYGRAALPQQGRDCPTALQTVEGIPGLDRFSSILKQTRLAGLLNDPAFPATVFAVRDEALAGAARLLSSNTTLAAEQSRALVHYHILPFSLSKAVRFDAAAKQFTTLLGQPVSLRNASVPVLVGAQNSSILLSGLRRPSCQAEVYVVDGVLIPDLELAANSTATRAASQGLKTIRAAPSRRLLARADTSLKTASHAADKATSHTADKSSGHSSSSSSHASQKDAAHHHSHDEPSSSSSSGKAEAAHHRPDIKEATSEEETIRASEAFSSAGRKGPADSKEAGAAADGKLSKKQQREAEAERQALAVPDLTSQEGGSSGKGARQELSTLTTGSGEGMADSKHTTVSAGSRADKQEPKDELDSLGATTPNDLSEEGQVGAEAADHVKETSTTSSKKVAAADKTLESDLQTVYSHSHKPGKKGSGAGVLKSIMGIFSGGEPSESDYQHRRNPELVDGPLTTKATSTGKGHAEKGSYGEKPSHARHSDVTDVRR